MGLIETTNNNDLGPQVANDPVKPDLQEYQQYFKAVVEHFINRDLQRGEITFIDDNTDRLIIDEWNVDGVQQPTKQQVINYYQANKKLILQRWAYKQLERREHAVFMEYMWNDYKANNMDYQAKKQGVDNGTIQELKDYINGV